MKMNRQLINLFYEIKRNLTPKNRAKFKLSDPKMADKLLVLHTRTKNLRLKYLIESFLEHSDLDYQQNLLNINKSAQMKFNKTKEICEKIAY